MRGEAHTITLAAILALPATVGAATWSVPSQCPTIQAGIDSASAGDTVLVACGTYYEHDIVMKSGVCLRSEEGTRECVTIDAESGGPALICENALDAPKVEGITLAHGVSEKGGGAYCMNSLLAFTDCGFSENFVSSSAESSGYGGAIYCESSSCLLTNCVFWANGAASSQRDAGRGGAIHTSNSSLVLVDCTLSSNLANGWYPDAGLGGAVYASGSSLDLSGCVFTHNAGVWGGGIYCEDDCSTMLSSCFLSENEAYGYDILDGNGGGLLVLGDPSATTLVGCTFSGNITSWAGGGVFGSARIDSCEFSENSASHGGGIYGGGVITHTVFDGNAGYRGGALRCVQDSSEVTSCTFYGNEGHGAGIYISYCSPVLRNSIFAFSTSGSAVDCEGLAVYPEFLCCDIYGNAGGDWMGCIANFDGFNGNMSKDPLFCDAGGGDLHLDVNSPCSPERSGACGLIGARGVACEDPPPDLGLGVFQNPLLTQYLDIYLISSEELDSTSVQLQVGADTVDVRRLDDIEHIWMGDYELVGSGDSISIQTCASDIRGNETCAAMEFSAILVAADAGGVARSVDGRLWLTIGPRALDRDSFVLVLPGDTAPSGPARLTSGSGRDGFRTLLAADVPLPSYRLSPDRILSGPPVSLEISYAGSSLESESPDRLVIEREGVGPLECFVDAARRTVTATISEFGTFRLVANEAGSSQLVDAGFLTSQQNFPNPFTRCTTVHFEIRAKQQVQVSVYDVGGRLVTELLSQVLPPGCHQVEWGGLTDGGCRVAAGVYFLRVQSEERISTKKILLVR